MKFSVLMPVYIKENPDYLRLALDSILVNQTIKPSEVVIVEDGPITPVLTEVLDRYENEFAGVIKRFKLPENVGMGNAMNFGLHRSSFEWIARMDSDDIARPQRFEKQVEFLRLNPGIDMLGGAIEEFDKVPGDLSRMRSLPIEHESIVRLMRFRNPFNHMTVFFRKDLAIRAGGYWSERNFEDYNLWYEMKKVGTKFHNLPAVLVDARVGNSMVERRRGYTYFKSEKLLLKKFVSDRFISKAQFSGLYILKFVARMVPTPVLAFVYSYLLRSRSAGKE